MTAGVVVRRLTAVEVRGWLVGASGGQVQASRGCRWWGWLSAGFKRLQVVATTGVAGGGFKWLKVVAVNCGSKVGG